MFCLSHFISSSTIIASGFNTRVKSWYYLGREVKTLIKAEIICTSKQFQGLANCMKKTKKKYVLWLFLRAVRTGGGV